MTPKHEAADAMGMERQRDEGQGQAPRLPRSPTTLEDPRQRRLFVTVNLLPCPFCGGTDLKILSTMSEDEPERSYARHVFCTDCHCHGRNNFPIGWTETDGQAIEAWNRRATTQPAEQSASSPVEGEGLDVAQSLRDHYAFALEGKYGSGQRYAIAGLLQMAFTEIERLRLTTRSVAVSSGAVDQIATMIFDNPKIPGEFNLSDARELARSILEAHPAHEAGEVERLRAGLKHYACSCEPGSCAMSDDGSENAVDDQLCGRVARAALEDKAQGAQQ